MRHILVGIGLGALVLATGCPNWSNVRNPGAPAGNGTPVTAAVPDAVQLVTYLNTNSAKIPTLQCDDLIMDCKMDGQSAGLQGKMICQRPRSFYMTAKMFGKDAVLIGSNDREFWYWISEAKPAYLFHCSYDDFNTGRARAVNLPIQPDWLLDAVGMSNYDPNGHYQVVPREKTIELVQDAISPQGQRVRKVTVFSRTPANTTYGNPQVLAHLVLDEKGTQLCAVHITKVQVAQNGAVVPKQVRIEALVPGPDGRKTEKTRMDLRLEEVTVANKIEPSRAAALFSREHFTSWPGYDLARGEDRVRGSVQPAGGFTR